MITVLAALALWAVAAAAVCALLAAGTRRARRQDHDRARALRARHAVRHTPSWARADRHGD
ncbi:hypothetical protein ACFXD5_06760 [Streptomyces sp. NPDC059385]|uniref:hypothetical protein n=1 Tax=Streptomyces sp. NPDC059385 TaxID=3346817 RepID=UPI0036791701